MGNLITGCILIAFVIAFTSLSSFIVVSTCEEIIALVDSGDIDSALQLWNRRACFISLFVRDAEIDVVTGAFENSDKFPLEDGERETANTELCDAIKEIIDFERISFYSVF